MFKELNEMGIMIPDSTVMTSYEHDYWMCRKNRIFNIDYDFCDDDATPLVDLGTTLILMNEEERDIPLEELKPIKIYIHSYGGDIDQAFNLCDIIQASRIPIITIGRGACMSAAVLILLAGRERYVFPHCNLMIHSGSGSIVGTAEQIQEGQKNYKQKLEMMKSFILGNSGIPENVFNKNRNKDWYITPDEIVKYDIAKIVGEI